MTRDVRMGRGRLALVVLATVVMTSGVGTAVAVAGDALPVDAQATAATGPAVTTTSLPTGSGTRTGTATPSGTRTGGTSTSETPCPSGLGTGGTGPVPASDFEDGTVGRWTGDSGVTLTNTGQLAASGTRSLQVEGVTGTKGLNLSGGTSSAEGYNWHKVTAKVRLAPGSAPAYVQLAPRGALTNIPGVARVTSHGWTTIVAWFSPSTLYWDAYCNGRMYGGMIPVGASLKVTQPTTACGQAITGTVTLFVDDVQIRMATSSGSVTGAPRASTPPEPASTPRCHITPSRSPDPTYE
ncbi:MAG: hypothetical protein QG671_1516 [Actinomycetota bacterium]|nr:hypothetical protein [Actinomycetota bacterium]